MADSTQVAVPAGVNANKVIKASDQTCAVAVVGSGFRDGATATWTPPGSMQSVTLAEDTVKFESSEKLVLTLVPGTAKGTGILLLSMPNGFSAVVDVTVA